MGLFGKKEDINSALVRFKDTDGAVLVDVRLKEDFKKGHIPCARNIPYNRVKFFFTQIHKDTPIFLYDDDESLAPKVKRELKKNGYTNVEVIGALKYGYRGGLV